MDASVSSFRGVATLTDVWEPANQLEQQLRDALRDGDQDTYFALVSGAELFVPLPPGEADSVIANQSNFTWPTSTREGRTHLLAYTSAEAARTCLGPAYEHFLRITLGGMAQSWPDPEWWLAINSGLPIEGYLPAWFVEQLTSGAGSATGTAPAQTPEAVPNPLSLQDAGPAQSFPVAPDAHPLETSPLHEATVRDPAQSEPAGRGPGEAAPPPFREGMPTGPEQNGLPPSLGQNGLPPAPVPPPGAEGVPPLPNRSGPPPAEGAPPLPNRSGPPPAEGAPPLPNRSGPPPAEGAPPLPGQDGLPPVGDGPQPLPGHSGLPQAPSDDSGGFPTVLDGIPATPAHGGPPEGFPPAAPQESFPAAPQEGFPPAAPRQDAPPAEAIPPAPAPESAPAQQRPTADETPVMLHITPDSAFTPLDEEERTLHEAAMRGDRESFLRVLLGVRQIWVPMVEGGDLMLGPGRPGFQWYTEESGGHRSVPVFTGPGRMRDAMGGHPFVLSDLAKVLRFWPDASWDLVVNGGTAIGGSVPGDRIVAISHQVDAEVAARLASDFPAQSDAERQMFDTRTDGEMLVKVLLDTAVFLPVWSRTPPAVQTPPGDPSFPWSAVPVRGRPSVLAFTSFDWMKAAVGTTGFVMPTFADLLTAWPEPDWSVSVNPGTPIEVSLTGEQIRTLVGSIVDKPREQVPLPAEQAPPPAETSQPQGVQGAHAAPRQEPPAPPGPRLGAWTIMQKVVPHDQVRWYLEQSYDRVAGFVHRVQDVVDLGTPVRLYESLGLLREGSPFAADDTDVHVIRWPAFRAELYRVPFGGQTEESLAAWGESGWVVEASPFGGDGFSPGGAGSIREYKVDSLRVPHGSEMYAIGADGSERFIARYDADRMLWGDSE